MNSRRSSPPTQIALAGEAVETSIQDFLHKSVLSVGFLHNSVLSIGVVSVGVSI